MRKLTLLLFLFALGLHAAAVFTAGLNGTATLSGSPFTTQQNFRYEARIQAWTLPVGSGARAHIVKFLGGNILLSLYNNSGSPLARIEDSVDGPSGGSAIQESTPGATGSDFVLRMQKDFSNTLGVAACNGFAGCMILEVWSINGGNYALIALGLTTPTAGLNGGLTIGDSTIATGTLGFSRTYSTLVAPGSLQPWPGAAQGDLNDYEFQTGGSGCLATIGLDCATGTNRPNPLTYNSTPSFAANLTYPPAVSLPTAITNGLSQFRSTASGGLPVTAINGGNCVPLDGSSACASYTWSVTSPDSLGFTACTSPTFTQPSGSSSPLMTLGNTIGPCSYTVQLVVTQGAGGGMNTTTVSQKYGAINANSQGIVAFPNAAQAGMFITSGIAQYANPWSTAETTQNVLANEVELRLQNLSSTSIQYIDYWNMALPGTITVTNGSPTVVGSGTSFVTGAHPFCINSGSAPFSPVANLPSIVVWYPIPTSFYAVQQYGRLALFVLNCTDDTHLTIGNGNQPPSASKNYAVEGLVTAGSSLQYAYMDLGSGSAYGNCGYWYTGNAPANYYDNVAAMLALWNRSGINDHLYWARIFAARFFSLPFGPGVNGIDKGVAFYQPLNNFNNNGGPVPVRSASVEGLMMMDNDSTFVANNFNMGAGLTAITQYDIYGAVTNSPCGVGACAVNDLREDGYGGVVIADHALYESCSTCVNPNPTQHTADLSALSTLMTNKWVASQQPHGEWVMNDIMQNTYSSWNSGGAGNFKANVTVGSPTVTPQSGFNFNCGNFVQPNPTTHLFDPPLLNNNYPTDIWFTSTGTSIPTLGDNSQGDTGWYYVQCNKQSFTPTGTGTINQSTIVVSSNTSLANDQLVTGTGIGAGAIVTGISGTTITLSTANTGTVSGTITFTGGTSLTMLSWNGSAWVNTNYAGSQGTGAGWELTALAGFGNQPFMNGIVNRDFYMTSLALATSDPTNAAFAKSFVLSNALWIGNYGMNYQVQTGFTVTTKGLYYGRDFPTCEPPTIWSGSGSSVGFAHPFCDQGVDGDRQVNAEGLFAVILALYLHPADSYTATLTNLGNVMMSAMYSCSPGDPLYDGTCEGNGNGFQSYATIYTGSKYFGFTGGMGQNWAWPPLVAVASGVPIVPQGVNGRGIIAEIPNVHTWAMKRAHL